MAQRGSRAVHVLWVVCALAAPAAARAQQPAAPFTLADALARARDVTPESQAARTRVEAATEALAQAGRFPNPMGELRIENWASGAPNGLPLDVFATVTHTVELGGKRQVRRGLAEAGLETAQAGATVVRRVLELDIARTYMEAVRARDRHQALATRADELAELVRIVASRAAVGAAPEADLLKMRAEGARANADVVRAMVAAHRALASLNARLAVETTLEALVAPAAPPQPALDIPAAVARRADVVAAGRVVDTARRQLQLEQSRWVPDVFFNGGVKRTAGYNTGVVAFNVPIPIFDHNRTARAVAQGQVHAAEFDREALARRAAADIAATHDAAQRLGAEAGTIATALLEPARGALDAARAAFSAGAYDILRLLDAERVHTDATLLAIDLHVDAVTSAIEARLAAGEDPLP